MLSIEKTTFKCVDLSIVVYGWKWGN